MAVIHFFRMNTCFFPSSFVKVHQHFSVNGVLSLTLLLVTFVRACNEVSFYCQVLGRFIGFSLNEGGGVPISDY